MITTEQAMTYFIEALVNELHNQYSEDPSIAIGWSKDDYTAKGLKDAAREIIANTKLDNVEKRIDEVSKNMLTRSIPRRGCR
jgi:hypothetical protein